MDILNVLEKATQINSVSGSENEIRKFISDNVKKYCDELLVDAMGNLIAVSYTHLDVYKRQE